MTRYEFIKNNCDVKKLHEVGITLPSILTNMEVMNTFLDASGSKMKRYVITSVKCGISEAHVRRIVSYMNTKV